MPRSGGTFALVSGNPVESGSVASSTVMNNTLDDIADELTNSIARDGQSPATANLPMGGYRHTNVGTASARNQYAAVSQVQDGSFTLVGSVAGTDTITGQLTPAITAYASPLQIVMIPAATNTGAVTLALNGLAAKAIVKQSTAALEAGDLEVGVPAILAYDGTRFFLLNPAVTAPEYRITAAEIAAGVTPTNFAYSAGSVERYGDNATPGTTDMAAALTAANAQAAVGGAPITANSILHIGSSVTITGPFVAPPNKQIFSATSTVVFAAGSVAAVYPEWWGTGVGTIQTARTAVSGKFIPVVLLSRASPYQFSTKLSITDDGAQIIGAGGTNDTEGGVYSGPVLEYTGTSGTAVEIGNAPDTNGNFISKVRLDGFILKVHENTDIALRGWHLGGRSVIRDITIRGNSDKDASENTGMKFEGCIDTIVERPIVFGQGTAATAAGYLNQGIWIKNGYSNSPTTTFDLIHPYVTQCHYGYRVDDDSTVNMLTPVMESCYNAGLIALNAKVHLITPHLEDNGSAGTAAIRLQGASSSLSIDGGSIDIGANETFISCEADCFVDIDSVRFASSHATPVLIGTGGNNPTVSILGNNVFPGSMIDWEAAYVGATNKLLKHNAGVLQGMTLYGLTLRVATQTPASAAATGTAGTIAWDASFLYVCTSTNAWKRVAIATW